MHTNIHIYLEGVFVCVSVCKYIHIHAYLHINIYIY